MFIEIDLSQIHSLSPNNNVTYTCKYVSAQSCITICYENDLKPVTLHELQLLNEITMTKS